MRDLGKINPDHRETESFLGLGRLAPFQVERKADSTTVRVFWARSLVWLVVVVLVGWMALAGGAYFFVKYRRGFSEVTYRQILIYPVNPSEYRRAKGQFLITEGKKQLEKQRYLPAFQSLRMGLAQVPGDEEARLYVAGVFHVVGRHDLAADTLAEGMGYCYGSQNYLQQVFGYLFQVEMDDRVVALVRELLRREDLGADARRLCVLALATAHFNRGRYQEAADVLAANGMTGERSGALLTARMQWEQNKRDEALKLFAALAARWPENAEIHNDYVNCLRGAQRWEDWRLMGVAAQLARPDDPQGYVDEVGALAAGGNVAGLADKENAILGRFADDKRALSLLCAYAAQQGRTQLAGRLYALCRRPDFPVETAAIGWVEACLLAGRPAEALQVVRQILADNPDWTERSVSLFGGLKAVAQQATGEPAEAALTLDTYLQTPRLVAPTLLPIALRFHELNAVDLERRVLARAVEVSPLNREASVRLIEWNLEHGEQEALYPLVQRLLTLRKPPASLLDRIRVDLQSDRCLMMPGREDLLGLL